jgi:16S rRNA (adenine1518-N6/adenine1519-N6)-dimethyltransferase
MTIIRPKKALGQHFLKDLSIAQRIAQTLSAYHDYPILEVGPGMGVLTHYLLKENYNLSVIEIDSESVGYLKNNFPALTSDRIIEEDFLQLDIDKLFNTKCCIIGNYPYYISSQIFFKVLENREQVICCSGMIQKEVAERITASPGKKTFGILSALIQPWFDVEYLFTVSERVFNPPPKVKSAVIRITRNSRTSLGCDEVFYKQVVKTAFNQRRKMLRNSLKSLLTVQDKEFTDFSLPVFEKRPEQLSVEQFIELTNLIEQFLKK